jgi:hypothetical protein
MSNEKEMSSHDLRQMGHCKDDALCIKEIYCNCLCLTCRKQDCFKPGCKCCKVHSYKGSYVSEEI